MTGWMILAAMGAAAAWLASLYLWPYAPCRRCGGTGRNPGSTGQRFGECRRCKGGGRRTRIGAKTVHRGAVSLHERARRKKAGGS